MFYFSCLFPQRRTPRSFIDVVADPMVTAAPRARFTAREAHEDISLTLNLHQAQVNKPRRQGI